LTQHLQSLIPLLAPHQGLYRFTGGRRRSGLLIWGDPSFGTVERLKVGRKASETPLQGIVERVHKFADTIFLGLLRRRSITSGRKGAMGIDDVPDAGKIGWMIPAVVIH
jgi:hypothetical protein